MKSGLLVYTLAQFATTGAELCRGFDLNATFERATALLEDLDVHATTAPLTFDNCATDGANPSTLYGTPRLPASPDTPWAPKQGERDAFVALVCVPEDTAYFSITWCATAHSLRRHLACRFTLLSL